MGWGLRATAPVDRGGLVIEYIGEVLDETQMQVSDISGKLLSLL